MDTAAAELANIRWSRTPVGEAWIAEAVRKAPRLSESQRARIRAALESAPAAQVEQRVA